MLRTGVIWKSGVGWWWVTNRSEWLLELLTELKIQILKGEVGPILYWLLLAGSSHQIIKFIIFSSSYLFQAAVCLVNHHHQYHEHRHHLHDHHQQHHKGWVRFLTMQHQTVTPPQTSTTMNLSSSGERRCPCLSSPWSSRLSTSTRCRAIPARWSPDQRHRPEGSTLVLLKPWSFTTHPSSGWRHSSRYSSLHHTLPSSSPGSL